MASSSFVVTVETMSTTSAKQEERTYKVLWSVEDEQWVATCDQFASLSWFDDSPSAALDGLLVLLLEIDLDIAREKRQTNLSK